MKRKQSLIGGLDRILSVRDASDLLAIPVDELQKFYAVSVKYRCGIS